MLPINYPDWANNKKKKVRQAKDAKAQAITEAKAWIWEKFKEAMEEDYLLLS